jgi:chorismate synthase
MEGLLVRELRGWEEMERVVDLQRQVWGRSESDLVPRGLLIAAQDEGGLVAGAFWQGEMVGFVFGFPTQDPGLQHSHMLGVLEKYRGTGRPPPQALPAGLVPGPGHPQGGLDL